MPRVSVYADPRLAKKAYYNEHRETSFQNAPMGYFSQRMDLQEFSEKKLRLEMMTLPKSTCTKCHGVSIIERPPFFREYIFKLSATAGKENRVAGKENRVSD